MKHLDSAKKSITDALKTASKIVIQKTAEATGDLISNKIADKITSVSKKSPKELHSQNEDEIVIPKERYTFPEKSIRMMNSQRSDTEKFNLIEEGKKYALMRLLNIMKLLIKV